MTTNATQAQNATVSFAGQPDAANGLALVRMTIGAMFVWVFFENLGKGGYTPAGYAGVINYYIKASHSPAAWKWVMGLMASHAAMVAPMQAMTEISLGVLLVIGLLTRPAAFVAFLFLGSLWISEWGTSWIWELLVPVVASLGLAVGRAGRTWGIDALLARRRPITKRRPLAVCLPISLPISSLRSSLSTAIRLTEHRISPERWARKSSWSLAEDTGALV